MLSWLVFFSPSDPDTSIHTCSFSNIQWPVQSILLCIVYYLQNILCILCHHAHYHALHGWAEQPDIQDTMAHLAQNKVKMTYIHKPRISQPYIYILAINNLQVHPPHEKGSLGKLNVTESTFTACSDCFMVWVISLVNLIL